MNSGSESWRYESAIAEVEEIIAQIEAGKLDLTEVVDQFDRAAQLLKTCETFLSHKRAQVDLIIEHLQDSDLDLDQEPSANPIAGAQPDDDDLEF